MLANVCYANSAHHCGHLWDRSGTQELRPLCRHTLQRGSRILATEHVLPSKQDKQLGMTTLVVRLGLTSPAWVGTADEWYIGAQLHFGDSIGLSVLR